LNISLLDMVVQESTPSEYQRVFAEIAQERPDAIIVSPIGSLLPHRRLIVELIEKMRLPAIYAVHDYVFDYLPDKGESDRKLAVAHGDGWKTPPRPASFFGVNAADADWVDRQCTMHPLSSFEAPAQISGACDDIANIGYIRASGFDSPFGQFYAKAGERLWWREQLAVA
jgi:hypothetical protein